jgi:hypothetical protein
VTGRDDLARSLAAEQVADWPGVIPGDVSWTDCGTGAWVRIEDPDERVVTTVYVVEVPDGE